MLSSVIRNTHGSVISVQTRRPESRYWGGQVDIQILGACKIATLSNHRATEQDTFEVPPGEDGRSKVTLTSFRGGQCYSTDPSKPRVDGGAIFKEAGILFY